MAHKKHYHYLVYPFCENENFEMEKIYNVIALDSSNRIEDGNQNLFSWVDRNVRDIEHITEKITGVILINLNLNEYKNIGVILYNM